MKAIFFGLVFATTTSLAGDWPMWRHDAGHGGSTPHALPASELQLQWSRQLPEPAPAWPVTQAKLQFDIQAEPVVMGERIFVPSSKNDSVTAFSNRTGELLWRFFADGPIRFAPVADSGRVFFNSDDGCLYAVNAETGDLIWKVNGGPDRRWLLGNHRLISAWPSRGGPVLHEGKLFFAASIWPFMGIFIHAVDPETGKLMWTNSGDGTNYTIQPHDTPAFAGVVPQGHLAANGTNLIVPGGRSTPGVYDTETGKQKFFEYDKKTGGHDVMATNELLFVAGHAYQMDNGKPVGGGAPAVFDDEMMIASDPSSILARALEPVFESTKSVDRKGKTVVETETKYRELFRTQLKEPMPGSAVIKAGDRIYSGGQGKIAAYDLKKSEPVWQTEIEGEAYTMLAADDRLFVVTREGKLLCFGAKKVAAPQSFENKNPSSGETVDDTWVAKAKKILEHPGASEGYAIVPRIGTGRLIDELLTQSQLHIIAIDPDAEKVKAIRERMVDSDLYGSRFSAFVGDAESEKFPPYLCNLITSEVPFDLNGKLVSSLRPFGGTAVSIAENGEFKSISREGPLPNSDDWTHQYGNAAQTVVSRDGNVKAPFGVLWFGGPSHEGVLPRHGHGPSPQIAGGRLFIEGADMLRAVDVYTGRKLWEKELPGFGEYYDTTAHFAGAGEIGSNYVSMPDEIYAVMSNKILAIDATNGATKREFQTGSFWGHLSVEGDFLVATSAPVEVEKTDEAPKNDDPAYATTSIIPHHAKWQYLAGNEPEADWTKLDFKTGADWKSGEAGFGYGDNDDKTELAMKDKFASVFIRHEFEAADTEGALILSISYDDAFVAYLNGEEVVRRNVSDDGKKIGSHEAKDFEQFAIKAKLLTGKNVLAIEGHNTSLSSSDFTLDPILLVKAETSPPALKSPRLTDFPTTRFSSGSRFLKVFNRKTGEKLWEREAEFNFRHNNIAVAADRIFCIDKLTEERAGALSRRGMKLEGSPTLYALDLKTGDVIWKHEKDVFGTFLNYSAEHDILLQAGSKSRDRAADDIGRGMMAVHGKTGDIVWHDPDLDYNGPCLLWHDQIITNGTGGFALGLLDGKKLDWTYSREYGCNTAIGSEHMLTFRSAAAGFFDLKNKSGTGNLGGFKSSCTNNLIVANGVLNAPDYTRTCTCSYQNQTSLALIHMPEAEFWTFGGAANPNRIGVNFGAPGDRRSEDGTLFVEYPSVGGKSEEAEVRIEGSPTFQRIHSSLIGGGETPWLLASAMEGASEIAIHLPEKPTGSQITIRLWFAEQKPETKGGERVFDVSIGDSKVLSAFDIAQENNGAAKGIVKTFILDQFDGETVKIGLKAHPNSLPPLISALEIVTSEN